MTTLINDALFAPLDADLHLERIAGGNETEVYCTDDRCYVVKVKSDEGSEPDQALARAQAMRRAADGFAAVIGAQHSIPNSFIVAANSQGQAQPVIIQPYYQHASPLFTLDYSGMSAQERRQLAGQLLHIMRRSIFSYLGRGWMPDLYGRASTSKAERKRLNTWHMLPWRLWSFFVQRNLLRSHNLLLTAAPERRLILVDYDAVPHSKLYQFFYYVVRLLLFLRDLCLILLMAAGGRVPKA